MEINSPAKFPVINHFKVNSQLHLTDGHSRPTITYMTDTNTRINKLEEQVSELIEISQRLGNENKELRAQLQHLTSERSGLIEQKEKVRVQVESMITRLRSMEKA